MLTVGPQASCPTADPAKGPDQSRAVGDRQGCGGPAGPAQKSLSGGPERCLLLSADVSPGRTQAEAAWSSGSTHRPHAPQPPQTGALAGKADSRAQTQSWEQRTLGSRRRSRKASGREGLGPSEAPLCPPAACHGGAALLLARARPEQAVASTTGSDGGRQLDGAGVGHRRARPAEGRPQLDAGVVPCVCLLCGGTSIYSHFAFLAIVNVCSIISNPTLKIYLG